MKLKVIHIQKHSPIWVIKGQFLVRQEIIGFEDKDVPRDLGEHVAGAQELPETMQAELRELGLL